MSTKRLLPEAIKLPEDTPGANVMKDILNKCALRDLQCKWRTHVCVNALPGTSGSLKIMACAYDTTVHTPLVTEKVTFDFYRQC